MDHSSRSNFEPIYSEYQEDIENEGDAHMSARTLLTPELNRILHQFVRYSTRGAVHLSVNNSAATTTVQEREENKSYAQSNNAAASPAVMAAEEIFSPPSSTLFEPMSDDYESIPTEQTLETLYSISPSIQKTLVDAVRKCDVVKAASLKQDFANTGTHIEPNVAYEEYALWLLRQEDETMGREGKDHERYAYGWWDYAPGLQDEQQERIARVYQYMNNMMLDKRSVDDVMEFALTACRHGYSEFVGPNAFRYLVHFGNKSRPEFEEIWERFVETTLKTDSNAEKTYNNLVLLRNIIVRTYISRSYESVESALSMVEDLMDHNAGIPKPTTTLIKDTLQTVEPWTLRILKLNITRRGPNTAHLNLRLNNLISKTPSTVQKYLETEQLVIHGTLQKINKATVRNIVVDILESDKYDSEESKIDEAVDVFCLAMEKSHVVASSTLSLIFSHMVEVNYKDAGGLERCRDKVSWALRHRTGTLRQLWWTSIILTMWRIEHYKAGVRIYREQYNSLGMPPLGSYVDDDDYVDTGSDGKTTKNNFVHMLCNLKPILDYSDNNNNNISNKISSCKTTFGKLPFIRPNSFAIMAGYLNLASLTKGVQELWNVYEAFLKYNGARKTRSVDPKTLSLRSINSERAMPVYDLLIKKFSQLGGIAQAAAVFVDMMESGIPPDERQWCLLLRGISHVYGQIAFDLLYSVESREWEGIFRKWREEQERERERERDDEQANLNYVKKDTSLSERQIVHFYLQRLTRIANEDLWLPQLSSEMIASLLLGFLDTNQREFGSRMASRLRDWEYDLGPFEQGALSAWESKMEEGISKSMKYEEELDRDLI